MKIFFPCVVSFSILLSFSRSFASISGLPSYLPSLISSRLDRPTLLELAQTRCKELEHPFVLGFQLEPTQQTSDFLTIHQNPNFNFTDRVLSTLCLRGILPRLQFDLGTIKKEQPFVRFKALACGTTEEAENYSDYGYFGNIEDEFQSLNLISHDPAEYEGCTLTLSTSEL